MEKHEIGNFRISANLLAQAFRLVFRIFASFATSLWTNFIISVHLIQIKHLLYKFVQRTNLHLTKYKY